jgi:hypothetical protein
MQQYMKCIPLDGVHFILVDNSLQMRKKSCFYRGKTQQIAFMLLLTSILPTFVKHIPLDE